MVRPVTWRRRTRPHSIPGSAVGGGRASRSRWLRRMSSMRFASCCTGGGPDTCRWRSQTTLPRGRSRTDRQGGVRLARGCGADRAPPRTESGWSWPDSACSAVAYPAAAAYGVFPARFAKGACSVWRAVGRRLRATGGAGLLRRWGSATRRRSRCRAEVPGGSGNRSLRISIRADDVVANVVVLPHAAPQWSKTVWYGAHGAIIRTFSGPPPVVPAGTTSTG